MASASSNRTILRGLRDSGRRDSQSCIGCRDSPGGTAHRCWGILAAETEFLTHVFMPVFRQRLGGFDAETMEIEIVLIFIVRRNFFGDLGGCFADRDQLQAEHIEFARLLRSEKIGDAQSPPACLPGKAKRTTRGSARPARGTRLRAVAPEFLRVIDNQLVALDCTGKYP